MADLEYNKDEAFKFISNTYRGLGKGFLLVWTLPDKASYWLNDPGDIFQVLQAIESGSNRDVYIGTGISPKKFGKNKNTVIEGISSTNQRCKVADIIAIPGVWIDIDMAGEAHKKLNLPETIEQTFELLKECPIAPTIIVQSGHGVQAWWLFHQLWYLGSEADRIRAEALLFKWKELFKANAARHKWDCDSTHDMARVMRLPGTINNKIPTDPKAVRILSLNDGRRYAVEELENSVIDVSAAPTARPAAVGAKNPVPIVGEKLSLDPRASPPFDKWQVMESMEPKFRLSWERKRKDFKDQSPSTYDLSLASMMLMVGWSPQEVTNSLIASRRQNGDDLKLREDYYLRTIKKAKASITEMSQKTKADEFFDDIEAVPGEAPVAIPDKTKIMEHISALFGIEITRIIKYTSYPAQYCLVTPTGKFIIGLVAVLISQNTLRNCIAEICGRIIPPFKTEKWRKIAQALLDAAEPEEVGFENTTTGQVAAWLISYLNRNTVLPSPEGAYRTQTPFMKDDHIMIFLTDLRKWLSIDARDQTPAKTMGAMLRTFGCRPEVHAFKADSGQTTRNVWRLPQSPDIMEFAPIEQPIPATD